MLKFKMLVFKVNINKSRTILNPFFYTLTFPRIGVRIIELEPNKLSKICFFWSNPYKSEVMITSLKEILELSKFGYMTTSTR